MRKFLAKLIFRLLDRPRNYDEINDKKIKNWLEVTMNHRGFRDYFKKRDLQLLTKMGKGVDRENYLLLVGQRLELLRLLTDANKAIKKVDKNKKE